MGQVPVSAFGVDRQKGRKREGIFRRLPAPRLFGQRAEKFICACHNSEWNAEGATLAGPTPRGLDTLEFRVEDDKLKVKYQDFKQGITTKEVLS